LLKGVVGSAYGIRIRVTAVAGAAREVPGHRRVTRGSSTDPSWLGLRRFRSRLICVNSADTACPIFLPTLPLGSRDRARTLSARSVKGFSSSGVYCVPERSHAVTSEGCRTCGKIWIGRSARQPASPSVSSPRSISATCLDLRGFSSPPRGCCGSLPTFPRIGCPKTVARASSSTLIPEPWPGSTRHRPTCRCSTKIHTAGPTRGILVPSSNRRQVFSCISSTHSTTCLIGACLPGKTHSGNGSRRRRNVKKSSTN
jgi:hypothetical protein